MAEIPSELSDLIVARLAPLLDQKIDVIVSRLDSITESLLSREQKMSGLTVPQDSEKGMRDMPPKDTHTTASLARFHHSHSGQNTSGNGTVANRQSKKSSFESQLTPVGLDEPERISNRARTFESQLTPVPSRILNTVRSWNVGIDDEGRPYIVKDNPSPSEPFGPCRFVHWLVWHPRFDAFWLGIITLNALFMGAQLEMYVRSGHNHWSNTLGDTLFTALFCIELLVRLVREGISKYFCGKERAWAILDVIILSLSFADVLLHVYDVTTRATSLRIGRVFRVLRIGKVLRGIRFLRDLRLLIVGMINSIMSIFWTVFALIFLMYTGSVIVLSIVVEDVIEGNTYYVEFWGSIATSMCTLFQVMSGDGWWSVVATGVDSQYPGMRYFFMAYYSITAYGLLNIVTGIFVEQTLNASKTDAELLQDKRLEDRRMLEAFFHSVFEIMDTDGTGHVDFSEFMECIKDADIRFAMERAELRVDDVVKVFSLLDGNVDAAISCEEFVSGCMKLRGQPTLADIMDCATTTRRAMRAVDDLGGHRGESVSKVTV